MALSIRFTYDPPVPYHTLEFHMNRGIKQKYPVKGDPQSMLSEFSEGLKLLLSFPENFSIVVLPSKLHAFSMLQQLIGQGMLFCPLPRNRQLREMGEIIDSGLIKKEIFPDEYQDQIRREKPEFLICRDVDPTSGMASRVQDILGLKSGFPNLRICPDLSNSFMNFALDFKNFDGYLFDTGPVTGMHPPLTVMVVNDSIYRKILDGLGTVFFPVEPGPVKRFGTGPEISIHHETDILKLFVFKEIIYDLIRRDVKIIRNEIVYKSIIMYQALEKSVHFKLLIEDPAYRSPNIIAASVQSSPEMVISHLQKNGFVFDMIPRNQDGMIIRFSNFPVHSKEQVEFLADIIMGM